MHGQAGEVADTGLAAGWFSDVAWNVAVHGGPMAAADRGRLFTLCRLFLQGGPHTGQVRKRCTTRLRTTATAGNVGAIQYYSYCQRHVYNVHTYIFVKPRHNSFLLSARWLNGA